MASFGIWDYLIVLLVLLCSTAVGFYYRFSGGKQKTTAEFLLADRSMTVLTLSFSLMTTYTSAITMLGTLQEVYQSGTMFSISDISILLSTPIIVHLLLPVFYRLKSASVYEYLEERFGYATRISAYLVYSLQMILFMGVALLAPALTLQAVTHINKDFSIIAVGFVCTLYSTLGGMKAVLISDVFQSLLMIVSMFSVIICAVIKVGGFAEIWNIADKGGRIVFSEISLDPTVRHTWWTQIFGGLSLSLAIFGVNPAQVQRMLTAKDLKTAKASVWTCTPLLLLLSLSDSFAGLCLYAFYRDCDPLLEGRIENREQLMPLFIMDTMGNIPGLRGFIVAGIFSASLSTISAVIGSLATCTLEDGVKPLSVRLFKTELKEKNLNIIVKCLTVFFGLVCIGMAYLSTLLGALLQAALSIFAIFGAPVLGVFINGLCLKWSNQKGVITGLFTSIAFCLWLSFGKPKPPVKMLPFSTDNCPIKTFTSTHFNEIFLSSSLVEEEAEVEYFYLYRISYMLYPIIGFLISFIGGILFSLIYQILGWDNTNNIYHDKDRTEIKHELFLEPIAKLLVKKQKLPTKPT